MDKLRLYIDDMCVAEENWMNLQIANQTTEKWKLKFRLHEEEKPWYICREVADRFKPEVTKNKTKSNRIPAPKMYL